MQSAPLLYLKNLTCDAETVPNLDTRAAAKTILGCTQFITHVQRYNSCGHWVYINAVSIFPCIAFLSCVLDMLARQQKLIYLRK